MPMSPIPIIAACWNFFELSCFMLFPFGFVGRVGGHLLLVESVSRLRW